MPVRAVLTETEGTGIQDTWINFFDFVVTESQPCHRLWTHVIEQDIRRRDELFNCF